MNEKHPYLGALMFNFRTSRTQDAKCLQKEKWVINRKVQETDINGVAYPKPWEKSNIKWMLLTAKLSQINTEIQKLFRYLMTPKFYF